MLTPKLLDLVKTVYPQNEWGAQTKLQRTSAIPPVRDKPDYDVSELMLLGNIIREYPSFLFRHFHATSAVQATLLLFTPSQTKKALTCIKKLIVPSLHEPFQITAEIAIFSDFPHLWVRWLEFELSPPPPATDSNPIYGTSTPSKKNLL